MALRLVAVLSFALAACSGPALVVLGESATPAPPIPALSVEVRDELGAPMEDAVVDFGDLDIASTDSNGVASAEWPRKPITVSVNASGYVQVSIDVPELPDSRKVMVSLDPVILEGRVRTTSGLPLAGAQVTLGGAVAMSDTAGSFRLAKPEAGTIQVSKAAFEPASLDWDGSSLNVAVALDPAVIRSVRASGPVAGDPERWSDLLELAAETEINAIVVDTKSEEGTVFHDTRVDLAHEIGAVRAHYEPTDLTADMQERGIYAITRIVTFQDTPLATHSPGLAIWDAGRDAPWETGGGQAWLDATNPDSWEYPIALGVEACENGFDEIQYDYVRFPTDGPVDRAVYDGPSNQAARVETIASFLAEARAELNPLGCAVAADIFSVVLSAEGDQGLGQQIGALSDTVDVINPMIYPSHYSTGWFGYECPNAHPGEVVAQALEDGMARMTGPAVVRPWLQDFTFGCGPVYGPNEVRSQIQAAERYDLGWHLWNVRSIFTETALRPAGEE